MLQELIDILKNVWSDLFWWQVLYEYEKGVVFRFGKIHREMKPGLNWKIPFVEDFQKVTGQDDTKQLRSQTVNGYVVTPVVNFYVKDAKKYFKKVLWEDGSESIVDDITASVITEHLLKNQTDSKLMLKDVREHCNDYGFRVRNLSFSTFAEIPTIRLIHDQDNLND